MKQLKAEKEMKRLERVDAETDASAWLIHGAFVVAGLEHAALVQLHDRLEEEGIRHTWERGTICVLHEDDDVRDRVRAIVVGITNDRVKERVKERGLSKAQRILLLKCAEALAGGKKGFSEGGLYLSDGAFKAWSSYSLSPSARVLVDKGYLVKVPSKHDAWYEINPLLADMLTIEALG